MGRDLTVKLAELHVRSEFPPGARWSTMARWVKKPQSRGDLGLRGLTIVVMETPDWTDWQDRNLLVNTLGGMGGVVVSDEFLAMFRN